MAPDESSTLLELYKTAVEMADRTSARRAGANSFFLTLNTALAAVVGIVSSARKPPPHSNLPLLDAFGLVVTAVAGIVLAFVWWLLLRYYRRLNTSKFQVINQMEERLPVRPFTEEWAILHPAPGDRRPEPIEVDPLVAPGGAAPRSHRRGAGGSLCFHGHLSCPWRPGAPAVTYLDAVAEEISTGRSGG